ncbi:MAG: endonuclease [Niallia nealsonii]|nr:endonuclease [Niallia nealsonii]
MILDKYASIENEFSYEGLCMITGKLLGDGNLFQSPGRQARLRFSHRMEDKEWTYHCYHELKQCIPLVMPKYRKIADPRISAGYTEHYYSQSRNSKYFSELMNIWYPQGKKILPFTFLERYLNVLALAWFYQDDGCLIMKDSKIKKIILSTECFSMEENKLLAQLIYQKFHIQFSQDKQNRLLLYDQKQILYFLHMIDPYLHSCMNRKRRLALFLPSKLPDKRTTIKLPLSITIKFPTEEIYQILDTLPKLLSVLKSKNGLRNLFINDYFLEDFTNTKKSYQIIIKGKQRDLLEECNFISGLNNSQITELCYRINKMNKKEISTPLTSKIKRYQDI